MFNKFLQSEINLGTRNLTPVAQPAFDTITPQPSITCERIKSLLSRGMMAPATLSLDEIREMAAAVVYHLLAERAA